ncbi:MAG: class I SAM-dependent methyltransferase [Dehalococcoidia bacterium]
MPRWTRSEALLAGRSGRLLDLGCAFGFGTRRLARHFWAVGVDVSADYIRRAAGSGSSAHYCLASGANLPFGDAGLDVVVALDVLEHVPDEAAVVREIVRVLRPGGLLALSVPHRGLLQTFDSYNVCASLLDAAELAPGRSAGTGPLHRHYSEAELVRLLSPELEIGRTELTGLGLAEFVNIALLWLCKRLLLWPRLYDWLQYLYFSLDMAEDLIRFGRFSYHIMVLARRTTGVGVVQPRASEGAAFRMLDGG